MSPYYTVSTPNDAIATTATAIRKTQYFLYKDNLPLLDDDLEISANELSCLTGETDSYTISVIMAMYRLQELPQLKALQEELFHLDLNRLRAIDDVLCKLDQPSPEALERIDAALTKYLTPKRENQVLPSVRHIRRKVNALIAVEDPRLGEKKKNKKPSYASFPLPGGMGGISGEYDAEVAAELDTVIRETAKAHDITCAEALQKLIVGELQNQTRVVLNVFKATDLPHAPVYIQGFGWADAETGQKLADRAHTVRDMEEAAAAQSNNYVTPDAIKAYLNGRDGTCRYPGCAHPAEKCQKDHCVDFHAGGPTASWNLANLCQHHHNVKTDGRARYVIDPATDDIVWLFEDGTWRESSPEGPLAAKNRNWLQTVGQAIAARRKAAHEQAVKDYEESLEDDSENKED